MSNKENDEYREHLESEILSLNEEIEEALFHLDSARKSRELLYTRIDELSDIVIRRIDNEYY